MRDFHDHQENAYQKTGRLILLLGVAILGTVICTGISLGYVIMIMLVGGEEGGPLLAVFLFGFGFGSIVSAIIERACQLEEIIAERDKAG